VRNNFDQEKYAIATTVVANVHMVRIHMLWEKDAMMVGVCIQRVWR